MVGQFIIICKIIRNIGKRKKEKSKTSVLEMYN